MKVIESNISSGCHRSISFFNHKFRPYNDEAIFDANDKRGSKRALRPRCDQHRRRGRWQVPWH